MTTPGAARPGVRAPRHSGVGSAPWELVGSSPVPASPADRLEEVAVGLALDVGGGIRAQRAARHIEATGSGAHRRSFWQGSAITCEKRLPPPTGTSPQ